MNEHELITALYAWQSIETMETLVTRLGRQLGTDVFQRRGRSYREAFIALRLAKALGECEVRLLMEANDTPTPDFEVRINGVIKKYETTEADIPGRRRQAEYRQPRPDGVEPVVFTSLEVMVEHMRDLAAKKSLKSYTECFGLVIYLNAPAFFFNPQMRMAQLKTATEPASSAFEEVWVVRDKGVMLWQSGRFLGHIPDDF